MDSTRRLQRGFTLFELAVVLIVFGVLAGVLFDRLSFYRAQIERLAADRVVYAMRTELQLRVAHLLVNGRQRDIAALARENPFTWLSEAPPGYLGELTETAAENISGGHWYFDVTHQSVVYLLSNAPKMHDGKPSQLKYRVKLINNRQNAEGKLVSHLNSFQGIALERVDEPPPTLKQ